MGISTSVMSKIVTVSSVQKTDITKIEGRKRMEIISRKDARQKGLVRYYTGKPCKHGHICERYVAGWGCLICNHLLMQKKRKNTKYREKERADRLAHYHENRDIIAKKRKERWLKGETKKTQRKYYERNKAKYSALTRYYQTLKSKRTLAGLRPNDFKKIYIERDKLNKNTGVPHHVDHIVPLQGKNVCGLHVPWNLQVITAQENISKSNKWEIN